MSNFGKRDSLKEEPGGGTKCFVDVDDWLIAYQNSIEDVEKLAQFIYLDERKKRALRRVVEIYHMRIPQYYFSLIKEYNNPLDPIRKQCVPSVEEIREEINEKVDPLGEEKTSPTPYLVHRYPDRVLLLVTSSCFMYCRHCTRKRLWKNKISEPSLQDIAGALDYVKTNKNIREIIISGGDPLTLSTERIDYILSSIKEISNITVVRIGTRAPVVMPQRIDDDLCAVLEKYNNLWINTQFNHPWEITEQSTFACRKLQKCGIPLSNQSVLLKGVNDDPRVMIELCQKLQEIRVRPYYLFQCDPVVGTGHFRTSLSKGVDILRKMQGYTSGMCMPKFVIDGIDGRGKVPLAPNYLVSQSEEGMLLRNYRGELFFYFESGRISKPAKKKRRAIHSIGIIFNLKRNNDKSDDEEEYDEVDIEVDAIESIKEEIKKLGFTVSLFEQSGGLADNLSKYKPGFVISY